MDIWTITEKGTGNTLEINSDEVERLVGVEISYIEWTIQQDGRFENGRWRVVS